MSRDVTTAREKRPLADLVREVRAGTLSREEALLYVDRRLVAEASLRITADAEPTALRGVPAGAGAGSGHAVFNAREGMELARVDVPFVLVAYETFPDDIEAMKLSRGVVTVSGGITGHAGVVSRGLGKPCIGSGSGLDLRGEALEARPEIGAPTMTWRFGDRLSFDGATGLIHDGPAHLADLDPLLEEALSWADAVSGARFTANVSTAVDAENAKRLGAAEAVILGSDALFMGRARVSLVDALEKSQPGADDRLGELLRSDLTAMALAFGKPVSGARAPRLGSNRDGLTRLLGSVCSAASVPFTEEPSTPSVAVEALPGARLAAALAVVDQASK